MDLHRLRIRHIALAFLAGAALGASSCAAATVIPLRGPAADIELLTGEWSGAYTSPDFGRRGTIWFTLVSSEDHAHGDVRMTPAGSPSAYRRDRFPFEQTREPDQFLSIRFVRTSGGDIDGVLEPYWDSDCGCVANTVFRGRLYGNRIEGTFETRLFTGVVALGRWQASRKIAR